MKNIITPILMASMTCFGAIHADSGMPVSPEEMESANEAISAPVEAIAPEMTEPLAAEQSAPVITESSAETPIVEATQNSEAPAVQIATETPPAQEQQVAGQNTTDQNNQVMPSMVGKASNESAKAAQNRYWQNIAIAVGVVAVAVTALLLVHHHHGKSPN